MNESISRIRWLPIAAGAVALATAAPAGYGQEEEEEEFDEARIFFELNDTDGDLGIHALIDGDAWKTLEIEGPTEQVLLNVWVRGRLRKQGLTEIFFESDEPGFDELTPAQFFRRFPEGTYEVEGITLDNEELESEIELSHVLAARPANIEVNGQAAAENCDAELPVVSEPITLDWDAVTGSHPTIGTPGQAVTVDIYQVIGEYEDAGGVERTVQVDLPPDVTSFELPEDFTSLAGDELKFEIITRLDNGNQTAVESCVEIE